MTKSDFEVFFEDVAGADAHPWQADLAEVRISDRLIRIPTGFGKTLGVLCAWLWLRKHGLGPRRLVWCLPMRVLVEQTESVVKEALEKLGLLWDGTGPHQHKIGLHVLMGGSDCADWHMYPEHEAVLIGTQDMLLSRAMNRGYGCPRARWPMEFAQVNHDCLWVMDEVQLMDVGLATSGQLQSYRAAFASLQPSFTWWMSATLQSDWLAKSPETRERADALPTTDIAASQREGLLWDGVKKPAKPRGLLKPDEIATLVCELHLARDPKDHGITLVVVNRVDTACKVFKELNNPKGLKKRLPSVELQLVHSRFRQHERSGWREAFLNKEACQGFVNRIVIATQVVEAGVDISAALLITELAPWPSLVQRFGRAARYGGKADVVVLKLPFKDDKQAAPYSADALNAAFEALKSVPDVSPLGLETFEDALRKVEPERLAALYPYAPKHLLLRHEVEELFDTTPDLSGADIDISRFIRSGDERDVQLFWMDVPEGDLPGAKLVPERAALCSAPFLKVREWLCGKGSRLQKGMRAWVFDYLDKCYRPIEKDDIFPGQQLAIAASCGGYDPLLGFDANSKFDVSVVGIKSADQRQRADSSEDDEALSEFAFQTIATHGRYVGEKARALANALAPPWQALFDLAGRWHDLGKVHDAFDNSIVDRVGLARPKRNDLAKAPKGSWRALSKFYTMKDGSRRPGFRHELASTLGLFNVLARHAPEHPALLGPWRELLVATGNQAVATVTAAAPNVLESEVLALSPAHFDLLAYLVCAHHGKVRVGWHSSPHDQAANDPILRIRGIRDGETLPACLLMDQSGAPQMIETGAMHLAASAIGLNPITGISWTQRVQQLQHQHGPFQLAYLETLLRVADGRASAGGFDDPLLREEYLANDSRTTDPGLATVEPSAATGADAKSIATAHRNVDGDGGGTGADERDTATTRSPHGATRYVETTSGRLSYLELAPLLSSSAYRIALSLADAEQTALLDDDFILSLHRQLCLDLTPQFAGRWRQIEVQIGAHVPPLPYELPQLLRNYALDLAAQTQHCGSDIDRLLELLSFAEGRLLWIHPFADFNGRVSRLFLGELLRRLNLPSLNLAFKPGESTQDYFAALQAYDQRNTEPLKRIWRQRFERGV